MADTNYFAIMLTSVLTTGGTMGALWLSRTWTKRSADEERDRHARYLAIRVVCVLDDLADGCIAVVEDPWSFDASGEEMPTVAHPDFELPQDVDWRTIDHMLMYQILQFPARVQRADDEVRFVWRNIDTGPDHAELYNARIRQFGQLALAAKDLAQAIREKYGIPPRDPEAEAGVRSAATSAIERQEARRAEQAEGASRMPMTGAG